MLKEMILRNKWNIPMAAACAGVLVDLFYDELSTSYYQCIQQSKEEWEIVEQSYLRLGEKLFIIIGSFLVIWAILAVLFPLIECGFRRLLPDNMPKISRKEVVRIYFECKKEVLKLEEIVDKSKEKDYLLYVSELALITNKMHNIFCSKKKETQSIVADIFRRGETIHDFSTAISRYEYNAVVDKMKEIEKTISGNQKDEIKNDCLKIRGKIEELKKVQ